MSISFINNAIASVDSSYQGNPYSFIIVLLVFILVFYFIIFRPQQKRNKDHRELMNSISKGDEVLTSGGLVGKVVKITETGYIFVMLNENINEIIIQRDCITAILPKGTMKSL
ncbi:preprotein translocase subunit YajC [Blochmannia endosymbiont of Camponotus (Colobopsis) obliquus]|uniref:preprotein translocase subunit YajC n=1 Tax=Blochmannia endosymbiont of Camponotus (Colobopsis) obliquus TaxID=1505597 RepID=UPI00061A7951|nr:preprotein translocase subunit YajC [Blochmannia endosymbiont of Camponotus (Colobopsis) obliquus]AKC60398.1 membrane protein [Blochmannia endosymbiont of Camponotus (Colobopsis) obliquus]